MFISNILDSEPRGEVVRSESFNLEILVGEDLRGYFKFPDDARKYLSHLKEKLDQRQDQSERVSLLGNIGVILLHLRELDSAEKYLKESVKLILDEGLDSAIKVQQLLRLANVYQWNKDFQKANSLFNNTILLCKTDESCDQYLDFAFQHYGKCLFDQSLFSEALKQFQEALKIREIKGKAELINSTEIAISVTKHKIKMSDS